jgi:hypothetical protein
MQELFEAKLNDKKIQENRKSDSPESFGGFSTGG